MTRTFLALALVAAMSGCSSKSSAPGSPDLGMGPLPSTFLWGSATSAMQTEGNSPPTDWTVWASLGHIADGTTDIGKADDSYDLYDQDLAQAQAMGHNAYRFSIEWARVEPMPGVFDQTAIDHYKAVVASCKAHGLEPIVTIEHFSLPTWVLDPSGKTAGSLGGWANHATADAYVAYVKKLVPNFVGDVKYWITLNEPVVQILQGYLEGGLPGGWPPGELANANDALAAFANMVDAHARAYDAIKAAYGQTPVSVTIAKHWVAFDPATPGADDAASKQLDYIFNQAFLNAIIHGAVDTKLDGKSIVMHPEYKGKLDLIGVNYYRHQLVTTMAGLPIVPGVPSEAPAMYHGDNGWGQYPEGMNRALTTLWSLYKLPLLVTENGVADAKDKIRAWSIVETVKQLQLAYSAGVDVRGYLHWSLLDNFELADGYRYRLGLLAVDYTSPKLTRTRRASADAYTAVIEARGVTPAVEAKYAVVAP